MKERIGIFGLGLIGGALARRLIAAGYPVTGTDPQPARLAELDASGGTGAQAAQVWQSDVILSAVFDTDQLEGLVAQAPIGRGGAIVSFSTCDPDRMPGITVQARAKGWHLIEAPLSGSSKQLDAGEAVFFVAGDLDETSRLDSILQVLGRAHFFVGPVGNGNRAKLAVNLILGLNRAALAEGMVFAESMELDPAAFLELAQNTAAQSQVMAVKGPMMVARRFEAQGRISQSAKDFGLIREIARTSGQHLPFAETYAAMMADCLRNSEGDLDNAAVILAIARSSAGG